MKNTTPHEIGMDSLNIHELANSMWEKQNTFHSK